MDPLSIPSFNKAFLDFRQIPFVNQDDGIFEVEFIEKRRENLEVDFNFLAMSKFAFTKRYFY